MCTSLLLPVTPSPPHPTFCVCVCVHGIEFVSRILVGLCRAVASELWIIKHQFADWPSNLLSGNIPRLIHSLSSRRCAIKCARATAVGAASSSVQHYFAGLTDFSVATGFVEVRLTIPRSVLHAGKATRGKRFAATRMRRSLFVLRVRRVLLKA